MKGYKRPEDEDGAEDVVLEGEQSQPHVGEDEVLCKEVQHLEQLKKKETESKCQ